MNKNAVINSLILLPFFWLFSGMLVIRSGDKTMIAMILISVIATLVSQGLQSVKHNLRNDKTLWVVLAMAGYAIFSYQYHGMSSRELRALLGASLFLLFFPRELLTSRLLQRLALVGAICSFGFTVYYGLYLHLDRGHWPINAIPQATLSASVGIISLVQLIKHQNKTELLLCGISLLLCLVAILFSQTRGIWLGFGATAGLGVILHLKNQKINWKFVIAGVAIFFAAGFSLKPQLEQRIHQTQQEAMQIAEGNLNTSIGLRLQMWQVAPQLVADNIAFGIGDQHPAELTKLFEQGLVSKALYQFKPAHYHNQYLDRMVKNGTVGLVLLLAILFVPLTQINKLATHRRYKIAGLVLLFSIASLTDVPFNHGQTILMYLLLVCGLASKAETER